MCQFFTLAEGGLGLDSKRFFSLIQEARIMFDIISPLDFLIQWICLCLAPASSWREQLQKIDGAGPRGGSSH